MGIKLLLERPQFALTNIPSNDTDIPDKGPLLFIPDITYITKFANGDLGIAENLIKKMFVKNLSSLKSINHLNIFLKATGYTLQKDPNSYFKNGKFDIPLSDITISLEGSLSGLKSLEKAVIQSIFESQKPYMEIIKIIVSSFVKIEDVIARASVFITSFPQYLIENSSNPLSPVIALVSCHSQKPSTNPKAAGYVKTNLSGYMNQLGELSKPSINNNQKITNNKLSIEAVSYPNKTGNFEYKIIDTQYSTGDFDSNVDYIYEYIDIPYLPINTPILNKGESYTDDTLWEKPDNIVFGFYDSLGKPIDPPDFILNNKKYFGTFSNYTKNSNLILNVYSQYIQDYTNDKLDMMNITDIDHRKQTLNLVSNIDLGSSSSTKQSNFSGLSPMIDRVLEYNYLQSFSKSKQNKFDILLDEKISYNGAFLPKKIKYKNKNIWIDPEAEYDFKIIKVMPILINKNINIALYKERKKSGKIVSVTTMKDNIKLFNNDLYSKKLYGSRYDKDNDTIERFIDINDLIYKYDYLYSNKENRKIGKNYISNDQYFLNWINNNLSYLLNLEVYYIVEGTYVNKKGGNPKSLSNSNGDYNFGDFIGIFNPFISLFIDIITKLFPQIEALEKIIKDPTSFLTDIVIRKLGDDYKTQSPNFQMFSTDFINKFNKIKDLETQLVSGAKNVEENIKILQSEATDKIKILQSEATQEIDKIKKLQSEATEAINKVKKLQSEAIDNIKAVVNNSILKKFIYVDKLGKIKFVLDGSATTSLFGLTFGLKLSELTFSLIFSLPNINSSVANFLNLSNDELNKQITNSKILGNITLDKKIQPIITNKEVDTIQYSTGVYIPGYTYTYIYQTQYESILNDQAKELEKNNNIPDAIQAYRNTLKSNPNNYTALSELARLLSLESVITQPILDFILKMITFPMNIIKKIIEYIKEVFEKMTNPLTLITIIEEFMTFKWILQFLSTEFIMKIAGITFDIPTWMDWLYNCETYPDDYLFDLNLVFGFDFMPPFPAYSKKQFIPFIKGFNNQSLNLGPLQMLKYILCLLEAIINSFIDLIWALLGIGAILKPPYIHLCKMVNEPSIKDIVDIKNGKVLLNNPDASYDFSYEINLPDGTIINSLDYIALEQWIKQNPDIQISFNF